VNAKRSWNYLHAAIEGEEMIGLQPVGRTLVSKHRTRQTMQTIQPQTMTRRSKALGAAAPNPAKLSQLDRIFIAPKSPPGTSPLPSPRGGGGSLRLSNMNPEQNQNIAIISR